MQHSKKLTSRWEPNVTETPATGERRTDPALEPTQGSTAGGSTVGGSSQAESATSGSTSAADRSGSEAATTGDQSDQGTSSEPGDSGEDLLARTRAGGTWVALIVFAVILILLLIFILENTKKVEISYFGVTGHLPLAVAMLLSAVAGVLLTAIAGTLRILQLRRRVRRSTSTPKKGRH
jgi:lipopolysaccharide assembly protein A